MHPLEVPTATKGPPEAMHVGVPKVSFFSWGWGRGGAGEGQGVGQGGAPQPCLIPG